MLLLGRGSTGPFEATATGSFRDKNLVCLLASYKTFFSPFSADAFSPTRATPDHTPNRRGLVFLFFLHKRSQRYATFVPFFLPHRTELFVLLLIRDMMPLSWRFKVSPRLCADADKFPSLLGC